MYKIIKNKIIIDTMTEQFIKSVRKTGTSLGLSIPKDIVTLLELKEGDIVRVSIEKVKKSGK